MSVDNFHWTPDYTSQIDRNIGLLTPQQQERLRSSQVTVMGLGGIGGTCFEVLVRSGIGNFCLVDKDIFDASNINRQIFAFRHTLGEKKVDTATRFAKDINPDVNVFQFEEFTEQNVEEIIPRDRTGAIIMGIDELKPCVIASRHAKKHRIPIVEGWALPYANVRVIDDQTEDLETLYGLPSANKKISDISDDDFKRMGLEVLINLGRIEGISEFYSKDTPSRIQRGRIPSFAPIVWLTAVMMATETIKIILNWGKIARGPKFAMYDPFSHQIPQ